MLNNKLVFRFTSRLNAFLSALTFSDFSISEIELLKLGAISVSNEVIAAIDDGRDLIYMSQWMVRRAAMAAEAATNRDDLLFWRGQMCFLASLGDVYKQFRSKNIIDYYGNVLVGLKNELDSADFFHFSSVSNDKL